MSTPVPQKINVVCVSTLEHSVHCHQAISGRPSVTLSSLEKPPRKTSYTERRKRFLLHPRLRKTSRKVPRLNDESLMVHPVPQRVSSADISIVVATQSPEDRGECECGSERFTDFTVGQNPEVLAKSLQKYKNYSPSYGQRTQSLETKRYSRWITESQKKAVHINMLRSMREIKKRERMIKETGIPLDMSILNLAQRMLRNFDRLFPTTNKNSSCYRSSYTESGCTSTTSKTSSTFIEESSSMLCCSSGSGATFQSPKKDFSQESEESGIPTCSFTTVTNASESKPVS